MQEEIKNKINSFVDLRVWQVSHKLALSVYKLIPIFPKYETFGLCDQIRRSVSSVSSNISEGFGRNSLKDKVHFYYMANGSLNETQNHLILAKDLGYIKEKEYNDILLEITESSKLINGLIKSLKSKYND